MEDADFQVKSINRLLSDMSNLFLDLQYRKEWFEKNKTNNPIDDVDYQFDISELEEKFSYYAKKVFRLSQAYFETKGLKDYLTTFNSEIEAHFRDSDSLLEGSFGYETGEFHSALIEDLWIFLSPFPEFDKQKN